MMSFYTLYLKLEKKQGRCFWFNECQCYKQVSQYVRIAIKVLVELIINSHWSKETLEFRDTFGCDNEFL